MTILKLINSLRKTDMYIEHIFMKGGCYQFHLFLKKLYPECHPFISYTMNHIVTLYKGKFYDITGIVKNGDYFPLDEVNPVELKKIKKWTFQKHQLIKICECPVCEEPITYIPKEEKP